MFITTCLLDRLLIDAVVDVHRKAEAQTDEIVQMPFPYRKMSPEECHRRIVETLGALVRASGSVIPYSTAE